MVNTDFIFFFPSAIITLMRESLQNETCSNSFLSIVVKVKIVVNTEWNHRIFEPRLPTFKLQ